MTDQPREEFYAQDTERIKHLLGQGVPITNVVEAVLISYITAGKALVELMQELQPEGCNVGKGMHSSSMNALLNLIGMADASRDQLKFQHLVQAGGGLGEVLMGMGAGAEGGVIVLDIARRRRRPDTPPQG